MTSTYTHEDGTEYRVERVARAGSHTLYHRFLVSLPMPYGTVPVHAMSVADAVARARAHLAEYLLSKQGETV